MWGDDLQELLGLYDGGPQLGMGEEFRGWDAYYFDVPSPPSPIALRAPGAVPSLFDPLPPSPDLAVTSVPVYRPEPAAFDRGDVAPLRITINKPTWFNSAKGAGMYDDPIYNYSGDPLTRIAAGQVGTVDTAGPFAGYSGTVPEFGLSDWARSGSLDRAFSALKTPQFNFRLPTTPTAQAILGTPAPAGIASLLSSPLLLIGAAVLLAVVVSR